MRGVLIFKGCLMKGKNGIFTAPAFFKFFGSSGCRGRPLRKDCNHQLEDRETEGYFHCGRFGEEVVKNFEVKDYVLLRNWGACVDAGFRHQ